MITPKRSKEAHFPFCRISYPKRYTLRFLKLASCKSLRFKAFKERLFEKRRVITSTLHALRIHVGQVGQIAGYSGRFRTARSQSPVTMPASNHRKS